MPNQIVDSFPSQPYFPIPQNKRKNSSLYHGCSSQLCTVQSLMLKSDNALKIQDLLLNVLSIPPSPSFPPKKWTEFSRNVVFLWRDEVWRFAYGKLQLLRFVFALIGEFRTRIVHFYLCLCRTGHLHKFDNFLSSNSLINKKLWDDHYLESQVSFFSNLVIEVQKSWMYEKWILRPKNTSNRNLRRERINLL